VTDAPASAEDEPGGYRDAFAVGEFRTISSSFLISMLGDSIAYLAITVLIYQRTQSSLLAALTFTFAFVPYLFSGTLLSALVDRLPPRLLLISCDLASACLVLLMTIKGIGIWVILVLLAMVSLISPVAGAMRSSVVAEVMPHHAYVPGRSVMRIISQSSQIFGNALGGVLLVALSPRGVLAFDALSFVLSAVIVRLFLHKRSRATEPTSTSLVRDSLSGVRGVLSNRRVRRVLLLSWGVPFVGAAPEALAAPATAHLGRPVSSVGFWLLAIPVGVVIGDLVGVLGLSPEWRRRLIWPMAFGVCAVMVPFFADPIYAVCLMLLFLTGFGTMFGLGLDRTTLDVTPIDLRKRMFAVSTAGLMVIQGIAFAVWGAIGEALDPNIVIGIAGVLGLFLVLLLRPPRVTEPVA
jgi:predicted MFS family arabinose efflux permease